MRNLGHHPFYPNMLEPFFFFFEVVAMKLCSLLYLMKNNGCVVTNLCWTAPHQSPHSAPSDRTGLAWSRPLPPPQTGQPLWSTRTPPPYECRHLTDKCSQVIFFFLPPLVVCCHAQPHRASFRNGRKAGEKNQKRTPTHTAQFCFISASHLLLLSCLTFFM